MGMTLVELLDRAKSAKAPRYIRNRDGCESADFWLHVDSEITKLRKRQINDLEADSTETEHPHEKKYARRAG